MKLVNINTQQEAEDFARLSATSFDSFPKTYVYTAGDDPECGEYMAIRWNDHALLVVRLDESFEPAIYTSADLIGKDFTERTV
jgi:hypothetical protein